MVARQRGRFWWRGELLNRIYKHRHILLAMFALISSACFCQYDPFAREYTRNKPQKTDVVGTYTLTKQTLASEPVDQLTAWDGSTPSTVKLALYDDGTFEATNLPVWYWDEQPGEWSIYKFVSYSGAWDIEGVGFVGDGSREGAYEVWGISLTGDSIPREHITLVGEDSPYKLIFGYDDPDSGYAMIYEKVWEKHSGHKP